MYASPQHELDRHRHLEPQDCHVPRLLLYIAHCKCKQALKINIENLIVCFLFQKKNSTNTPTGQSCRYAILCMMQLTICGSRILDSRYIDAIDWELEIEDKRE